MSELGASISIGVLAALVVLIIYLIASRIGRWQPAPQRRPQGGQAPQQPGYGPGGSGQQGHAPGSRPRGGSYDQSTRAYDSADAVPMIRRLAPIPNSPSASTA